MSRLSITALTLVLCLVGRTPLDDGRPAGQVHAGLERGPTPIVDAPPGARPGLSALAFATRTAGCAGGLHEILCTTDAGRTWVRRYAGPAAIVGLDFTTPAVGWAVGARDLLATTDGGRHWTGRAEPAQALRGVDFVTATLGWGIVGGVARIYGGTIQSTWPYERGTLVRTQDGARTWTAQPAAGAVDSFCFDSGSDGWAAAGGAVRRTSDGGRTWRTVATLPIGAPHNAVWYATIRCTGRATAWVLISGGIGVSNQQPYILFRTGDGGRHWRGLLLEGYFGQAAYTSVQVHAIDGPGGYIGPLSVVGPATAYVVGLCLPCPSDNTFSVIGTRDSGRTWSPRILIPTTTLSYFGPVTMTFVDASHGWIAGGYNRDAILATTDGGRTWMRQL